MTVEQAWAVLASLPNQRDPLDEEWQAMYLAATRVIALENQALAVQLAARDKEFDELDAIYQQRKAAEAWRQRVNVYQRARFDRRRAMYAEGGVPWL